MKIKKSIVLIIALCAILCNRTAFGSDYGIFIMKKLCKCGKETTTGRCKSCSNKERTGKFEWSNEAKEKRKNEGNPLWKGDNVKLYALHSWVKRRKVKPESCEKCKINKPYDLANISGKYLRDVNDFKWLCRSCHSKMHRGIEWHIFVFNKRKCHGKV